MENKISALLREKLCVIEDDSNKLEDIDIRTVNIDSYDKKKWKDGGHFYLYDCEQREEDWKLVRIGRPSGSNIGYLLDHGNPKFSTKEETVDIITYRKKKIFSVKSLEVMDHGTEMEPIARKWYEDKYGVNVTEYGFAVPKWDKRLGVSVDGVVGDDGIIEIKCPKKMYHPLKNFIFNNNNTSVIPAGHDHIWSTHYDQMMLGMAVMGKKWCDYIVYSTDDNLVFDQKIYFDAEYWKEMYKNVTKILDDNITPLLGGTPFPLMPS